MSWQEDHEEEEGLMWLGCMTEIVFPISKPVGEFFAHVGMIIIMIAHISLHLSIIYESEQKKLVENSLQTKQVSLYMRLNCSCYNLCVFIEYKQAEQ